MFFNPAFLYEHEFLLNFVVSLRGAGKTFSTLLSRVDHFRETGKQFVYLRRTEIERDNCVQTLLQQLQSENYHTDVTFRAYSDYITCNDKVICYCLALSTAYKHKSVSFNNVDFILFDEFIDENNRYLKHEVTKFLSFIETIGRMRDITVFCLGNQKTKYNPYYRYFDIKPSDSELTRFKSKSILIYEFTGAEYKKEKLKTKFGKLIAGTEYGDFMLENKAIDDDYTHVDKMKGCKKHPLVNLIINKETIVLYEAITSDNFYFYFEMRKPISAIKSVNYDQILIENTTLDVFNNMPITKRIKMHFKKGTIRFSDMPTKNAVTGFIFE